MRRHWSSIVPMSRLRGLFLIILVCYNYITPSGFPFRRLCPVVYAFDFKPRRGEIIIEIKENENNPEGVA